MNARFLVYLIIQFFSVSAFSDNCSLEYIDSLISNSIYGVTLDKVEQGSLPADHCLLEGNIANAENSLSNIKFRYRLPPNGAWNNKFLVGGNGGMGGLFQGNERLVGALESGYAVAQTDTGHSNNDQEWLITTNEKGQVLANSVAIEDFGHRSIHLLTTVGKQLIDIFYADDLDKSYYLGCSQGGRQGLQAMQMYPSDFDGIIAGAPVFNLTRQNMAQVWYQQELNNLEREDKLLTIEQFNYIYSSILNVCDLNDGVDDNIINNPLQCSFDTSQLICGNSDSELCLTNKQHDFIEKAYEGPISSDGQQIAPGRVMGSEGIIIPNTFGVGWADLLRTNASLIVPTLKLAWYQDPNINILDEFNINDRSSIDFIESTLYSRATQAINPNVSPFIQSGGKAILFHGWADPGVPALATIDFYNSMDSVVSSMLDDESIRNSVRLFLGPSMGHCSNGEGPNDWVEPLLDALDSWVVNDEAPDSINVSNNERQISMPWCPYPEEAKVKAGDLDTSKADSFFCSITN